jgi:predicted Na+-dependent transporter
LERKEVNVGFLRAALAGEPRQRNRAMTTSIALVAVGVVLIVVGAIAEWGWTRVVGAGLITVGGIGLGVLLGLVPTQRERLLAAMRRWRTGIVILAVVVLVLPILVALIAGVIGAFTGGGGNAAPLTAGTLIGMLLLAAVAYCAWIGVRATLRATRKDAARMEPQEEAA